MLTTRHFESGLDRIQNRVIGIHSGICSSDDYVKCMRRAAVAYSQIDACYIHWNYRSGIAMKIWSFRNHIGWSSGLKSKIVQKLDSIPKGRRRKTCGANNDSTASNQRSIRTANTITNDHEVRHHKTNSCYLRPSSSIDCQLTSTEWHSNTSSTYRTLNEQLSFPPLIWMYWSYELRVLPHSLWSHSLHWMYGMQSEEENSTGTR